MCIKESDKIYNVIKHQACTVNLNLYHIKSTEIYTVVCVVVRAYKCVRPYELFLKISSSIRNYL